MSSADTFPSMPSVKTSIVTAAPAGDYISFQIFQNLANPKEFLSSAILIKVCLKWSISKYFVNKQKLLMMTSQRGI